MAATPELGALTDGRAVAADRPPMREWLAILRRTISALRDHNLTDWAAALTYYAVLALFPALIVLVALVGLLGSYPQTTDALLRVVRDVGPASAVDTFRGSIEGVVRSKGGAGALLGVGLVGALWSASGYVGAFMRASNVVYETTEHRPFWKLRPAQVAVTLILALLVALAAVAIVLTGSLARSVGDVIGVGDTAVTVWNIAKWPVLALIAMAVTAMLYYAAARGSTRTLRSLAPGGALALGAWLLASGGFALYVANFGSYNKTYGSLGAIVVFLVWLWISNLALLLGAELNAELGRTREARSR